MNEKEPVLTGHQDRTPPLHSLQSAREAAAGAGELWAGAAPGAPEQGNRCFRSAGTHISVSQQRLINRNGHTHSAEDI